MAKNLFGQIVGKRIHAIYIDILYFLVSLILIAFCSSSHPTPPIPQDVPHPPRIFLRWVGILFFYFLLIYFIYNLINSWALHIGIDLH